MNLGVSSSCFYPNVPEIALRKVGEMGIKTTEIFINSPMELSGEIFREIKKVKEYYDMDVVSMHPFTSGSEAFFLFSEYKRRFLDMLDFYKQYMYACGEIGAKLLVVHGEKKEKRISDEEYYERFNILHETGKLYGVSVAQENVFNFASGNPEFLIKMKEYMGDNFKFVFDLKQMRRCGFQIDDFIDSLSNSIEHIHISDGTNEEKCLPPGKGEFDFDYLFKRLNDIGFNKNIVIELYRSNFKDSDDLRASYDYLNKKIEL